MVEAHGPGTPVGDPSNTRALPRCTASSGPCALGSVKTNFGHTQSAAGALGLMKAVLAVQHGVVPQNLHFTQLPDEMAQIETNLFVPQVTTPWPGERSPRAATGGGVVLRVLRNQRARHFGASSRAGRTGRRANRLTAIDGPLIFPLSSTSADGLRQTAASRR